LMKNPLGVNASLRSSSGAKEPESDSPRSPVSRATSSPSLLPPRKYTFSSNSVVQYHRISYFDGIRDAAQTTASVEPNSSKLNSEDRRKRK
jgi:hypothetical protein